MIAALAFAIVAATALDGSWLLTYAGKSTAAALNDRRLAAIVKDRVPTAVSGRVLANLGGASAPVVVDDARYVSLSGCRANDCPAKGLLWVDTKSGEALGAVYARSTRDRAVLTIGSKGISATWMPAEATAAIVRWLRENALDPDLVEFVGPSNLAVAMDPVMFR